MKLFQQLRSLEAPIRMSFDCTYVAITTFNFQILIPYFVNMINTMMMLQDGFFNVDTKY